MNIRKRIKSGGGHTFQVQVRVKGYPPVTATFDREKDAKAYGRKMEAEIATGPRIAAERLNSPEKEGGARARKGHQSCGRLRRTARGRGNGFRPAGRAEYRRVGISS